jgi:glucose-1-phosphate cytidylyltransferase
MKVVVLAGGYGTRLAEETTVLPKPMVEIGGKPVIWHIMKLYSSYGLNDFVICCGYKGHLLKSYFLDAWFRESDITLDMGLNKVDVRHSRAESWRVTLADTGLTTMTGGRLRRVREYIAGETFCLTYGDGLCDLPIDRLIGFHKQQGVLATVTGVRQPGRFGALGVSSEGIASAFREKPGDGHLINGGFFVLEPAVIDLIEGDQTVWEREPMERLVAQGQLAVYHHDGFWQNMDTLRDKHILQDMWDSGDPPWRTWKDELLPGSTLP